MACKEHMLIAERIERTEMDLKTVSKTLIGENGEKGLVTKMAVMQYQIYILIAMDAGIIGLLVRLILKS